METLNLTQAQLNELTNLILELPTKYGLPVFNLLGSYVEQGKKQFESKVSIQTSDNEETGLEEIK